MPAIIEPGSPWAEEIARLNAVCAKRGRHARRLALCAGDRERVSNASASEQSGDFDRFRRPGQLMSYLGMVPSEHSTGEQAPPRLDHEVRQPARPPAARRSGLALSAEPPRGRTRARAPPGRPAPAGDRDQLASPATPAPNVAAPGRPARQASHHRRGRSRPQLALRCWLLLGGHHRRLSSAGTARRWSRRRRGRPHFAPAHPRFSYEQPHRATLGSRPRALRRNPVLRPPRSAHISLTARRATRAALPPPRPTRRPARAGLSCCTLDKPTSISAELPRGVVSG